MHPIQHDSDSLSIQNILEMPNTKITILFFKFTSYIEVFDVSKLEMQSPCGSIIVVNVPIDHCVVKKKTAISDCLWLLHIYGFGLVAWSSVWVWFSCHHSLAMV